MVAPDRFEKGSVLQNEEVESPEAKLQKLGLALPDLVATPGNFIHAVKTGNLLFLAGKGPIELRGKVGHAVSEQEAKQAAHEVGLLLIRVMKAELGDLSRVDQIVKVLGFVNAAPSFHEHPYVVDGCSDLFVEVFGDKGKHARSAIGVGSLPFNIPVEVECVVSFT